MHLYMNGGWISQTNPSPVATPFFRPVPSIDGPVDAVLRGLRRIVVSAYTYDGCWNGVDLLIRDRIRRILSSFD